MKYLNAISHGIGLAKDFMGDKYAKYINCRRL